MIRLTTASILLLTLHPSCAEARCTGTVGNRTNQTVELGKIRWHRDFAQAERRAQRTGKPLLVLFDEIPGCSTVRGFGSEVLSHPLVVEAIESLFVPVLVKNNVGGKDSQVLRSFGEPSWNNPVVRILGKGRKLLAPRYAGPYNLRAFLATLTQALRSAGKPVPTYLRLLHQQQRAARSRLVLAMPCFWSGEATLGGIDGVVRTSVGWLAGREVVQLEYEAKRLSAQRLLTIAKRAGVASRAFYTSDDQRLAAKAAGIAAEPLANRRPGPAPSDAFYRLRHSTFWQLPMTRLQKTKINAVLPDRKRALALLSPRQRELLAQLSHQKKAPQRQCRGWR